MNTSQSTTQVPYHTKLGSYWEIKSFQSNSNKMSAYISYAHQASIYWFCMLIYILSFCLLHLKHPMWSVIEHKKWHQIDFHQYVGIYEPTKESLCMMEQILRWKSANDVNKMK